MAIDKLSGNSFATGAISNSLGYTPLSATAPSAVANSSANVVYMAANGNIGIGTSTPAYRLQTKGDAVGVTSADGTVTNLINYNTIGTINAADLAIVANNSTKMTVAASGYVGVAGTPTGLAMVDIRSNDTTIPQLFLEQDNTAHGWIFYADRSDGGLKFSRRDNSGTTERARFDTNGNLMIGQTTPNARLSILGANADWNINSSITGGASTKLHIRFIGDSTVAGTITSSGTSVGYNSASDYRLKENIAPMTGALELIMKQRPVTYTWKCNGLPGKGFIAHWMQEDGTGECVTGEKDAVDLDGNIIPQGIDTSFLVGTLTAAIQELNAKFEEYKASHP